MDAIIIGRTDNFSWLTSGGSNELIITSEYGSSITVFTKKEKFILAKTMDGKRVLEEELDGIGYNLINLKWYKKSKKEAVLNLVKNYKCIADIKLSGIEFKPNYIYDLHYPLTEKEIVR
ncbi:MAG: hypothetical protein A2Z35_05075 [Actinobacteria bacterium RBG_19FT_COMBO_36_27]|nr:MAG: hypothetical protein A2Z35_05075 [Actinobacteria bacterium RBG_19FT_COMBO_36_27]